MIGIFLTLFTLISRPAGAEEGFRSMPPAPPLLKAWESTVMLHLDHRGKLLTGAAVVIRRNGQVVDLLTANHIVTEACAGTTCDHLRVIRNVDVKWEDRGRIKEPSIGKDLVVVARDEAHDLAMLRFRTDLAFEPVAIADSCGQPMTSAVAIGFPATALRDNPLGISAPERLTKRWSQGHVLARINLSANGVLIQDPRAGREVLVTSVDALEGNSGGTAGRPHRRDDWTR